MWPFSVRPTVFVCHIPGDPQREEWCKKVTTRWAELDVPVKVLTPGAEGKQQFQRYRRMVADEKAKSKFYILADDDCLPVVDGWYVKDGLELMRRYPEYAILAPLPQNENIVEWTPDPRLDKYTAYRDENVFEHVSVGGVRFCRKGCLEKWPEIGDVGGYDGIQGEALRKNGYRVGYMRNLRFLHLGEGKSTVWVYV